MTDIQIKYWDFKEGQRHNLAYEGENYRHNSATEQQAAKELVEVNRHNLVGEGFEGRNVAVNERNAASNERNAQSNAMNANSNRMNAFSNQRNAETNRMNAYTNQRMASASETQAAAALRNAAVNEGNLTIAKSMVPYEKAKASSAAYKDRSVGDYDQSRTAGQRIDNSINSATKVAQVGTSYVKLVSTALDVASNLKGLLAKR